MTLSECVGRSHITEVQNQSRPFVPVTQEENKILWALQQYQKVIRKWAGALTLIEFAVLVQILDRTVGWQKTRRTITIGGILNGGRLYVGIGQAVKRSSVLKALRSLENKGIIIRRPDRRNPAYKEYEIILDWEPPLLTRNTDEPDAEDYLNDDDYMPSLLEQQFEGSA